MIKSKDITKFLNEDYSEAALYIAYRAMPSVVDGLKNSGRKIIYTAKKCKLKEDIKVSTYGSKVIETAEYLHGDAAIAGAVVTATQDFTGSNNLPVLKGEGNFGSRHVNQASASRYIFCKPQPYFELLFRPEDDGNLVIQEFEGHEIEPRFYVPTVPLLLINGSNGIGVGYKTVILNRNLNNIIEAIKQKLKNKPFDASLFVPSWNGFTGTVDQIDACKWQIKGIAKQGKNKRKVEIEELPINYTLKSYLDNLKNLKEKGIIDNYLDYSENDRFKFEVVLSSTEVQKDFDKIMEDLGLVTTLSEQLNCLDENNAITEFNSIEDIFNKYFEIRLIYLQKRINSEIARLQKESDELAEICRFLKEVIAGTINIKDKKANLEADMKAKGYTLIAKLLAMPISSITEERVAEINKAYANKLKELEQMKKETPKSIWLKDLVELEKKI